jgi:hypothetical protein
MSSHGKAPKNPRPMSKSNKIINAHRDVASDGTNKHFRDKATINRLAMYKQKAQYNRDGQFTGGAFMNRTVDDKVKRVAPDRRWFGTRV